MPVGTQIETPVMIATGWPMREHPHRAHDPLRGDARAVAGGRHEGATGDRVRRGDGGDRHAETITRGLGAVGIAWPPCAQMTTAPMCRIGPGMV